MSALELIILAYVLAACWQLPLVAVVCGGFIRVARNCPAAIRHWLWWIAILLSAMAPLGVLFGLYAAVRADGVEPRSAQLAAPVWRFALGVCAVMAAYHSVRLLRAAVAVRRLRSAAQPLPPGHALRERAIDIRLSPNSMVAAGPLLLGVWRPVILIPPFLIEPANAHLLEVALAHELAHVRRRDMLTSIISELALIPIAFHPAARWLRRKLGESRELACDEHVARENLNHLEYARCLLEIARNVLPSRTPLCALGIGPVWLELVLVNTTLSGRPSQSLGQALVTSMPPRDEVLSFPIPATRSIHQFDEATILFRIEGSRAFRSAKIAIERFVLIPRSG